MHSADGLGGWLVLPALLGVAALCLCAPQGRGARWTIAWFAVVSLCAAGIAATQSVAALLAIGAAAAVLLALRHLPSRRGLTAATAVGGLAILSLAPAIGAPTGDAFAAAGFGPSPLGLSGADPLARVAALLLSAALVLRRIRPLRLGRGSLAAWGGVAAVFGVACLGLVSSVLEVPAIGLTAAALAGLAWPNAVGSDAGSLRRTRAVLFLLTSGAFGAGVLHLLWGGVFVS
jgi:hypothetical protein